MLVAVLAAGVGCTKKDASLSGDSGSPSPSAGAPSGTASPNPASACPATVADGPTTTKPEITVPDCAPPATLQSNDLVVGTGAVVAAGAQVKVQYVGVAWSSKKEFDSSWKRGEPACFPLGGVIQGWGQGIPGMKVGGRRVLTIPAELGYGAQGQGPDIGPNETLVFVIDLLDIPANC